MAQQTINIGITANDGTGDMPRTVGQKVNSNFTELYSWARERVSTNRTYYVATTGSDSNSGLSIGVPFLTIQKAISVICNTLSIDAGVVVTVQVSTGTYTLASAVTLYRFTGGGSVVIQGNTSTPGNVILTSSALSEQFVIPAVCDYTVQGFRLQASAGTPISFLTTAGRLKIGNIEFNTGLLAHLYAQNGGIIDVINNYTVLAAATYHIVAEKTGTVNNVGRSHTVSGTPAFAGAFAFAQHLGLIQALSTTFTGSATGTRYAITTNSVINTGGGGANFFPGNVAGTTATGGQYV
jgi:hypothetical protein